VLTSGRPLLQVPASKFDFRPYLHIHDLDFRLLFNSNKPPAGVVVGVTVSFWPNEQHSLRRRLIRSHRRHLAESLLPQCGKPLAEYHQSWIGCVSASRFNMSQCYPPHAA
jgi:hypothetical protein